MMLLKSELVYKNSLLKVKKNTIMNAAYSGLSVSCSKPPSEMEDFIDPHTEPLTVDLCFYICLLHSFS
jgi:hypothetical protein